MGDQGKGWHGDPAGHARAGSQSSGNPNAAQNLNDAARSKGGQVSGGNFKNDPQRASEAGRKGGQASHGGRKQEERQEQDESLSMEDSDIGG